MPWALRFTVKVREDPSGCWLWTAQTVTGYGRFWLDGRSVYAHRLLWEYVNGPVPEGLDLDHLCRTRRCVRPNHLEPVSRQRNVLRSPVALAAGWAARDRCGKGHPFTPENTYDRPDGGRRCRACRNS